MDLDEKWDFFLKWLSKVSPFSPINTAAENLRDLHREEISGLKARILELESRRAVRCEGNPNGLKSCYLELGNSSCPHCKNTGAVIR